MLKQGVTGEFLGELGLPFNLRIGGLAELF